MPKLGGAWNFRDVADATGLRPGRFFRSSELSTLQQDGRDELRRLGITDVADLRSPREAERRGPGQVPDDVAIHLLPFPDLATDDASGSVVATNIEDSKCWRQDVPAIVGSSPAAISADVEARPVEHRRDHGRWCLDRKVSC